MAAFLTVVMTWEVFNYEISRPVYAADEKISLIPQYVVNKSNVVVKSETLNVPANENDMWKCIAEAIFYRSKDGSAFGPGIFPMIAVPRLKREHFTNPDTYVLDYRDWSRVPTPLNLTGFGCESVHFDFYFSNKNPVCPRLDTGLNSPIMLKLGQRGSYILNGVHYPSLYISALKSFTDSYSFVRDVLGCKYADFFSVPYPEKFLTCVHSSFEENKFYHMKFENDTWNSYSEFRAYWGVNGNSAELSKIIPEQLNLCRTNVEKSVAMLKSLKEETPAYNKAFADYKRHYAMQKNFERIHLEISDRCCGTLDRPTAAQNPYAAYWFWLRYYEKLNKGYIDNSKAYLMNDYAVLFKGRFANLLDTNTISDDEKSVVKSKAKANVSVSSKLVQKDAVRKDPTLTPDEIEANRYLYNLFSKVSRQIVAETFVPGFKITTAMFQQSYDLLKEMRTKKRYQTVNKYVERLMQVCPRTLSSVKANFATCLEDVPAVIEREENLVNAMFAVLLSEAFDYQQSTKTLKNNDSEVDLSSLFFYSNGIRIESADAQSVDWVKSHMLAGPYNTYCRDLLRRVYRVKPLKQYEKFETYVKDENISREKFKRFWHGSRTENWLSIILNSLQLHPDAIITGKMFGPGIYFAPSAAKSFGYTSHHSAKWTDCTSSMGVMGIYKTAFGEPFYPDSAGSYTANDLKKRGCNSLFADKHKTGLQAHEVVFYSESAMVLEYLCVFCD